MRGLLLSLVLISVPALANELDAPTKAPTHFTISPAQIAAVKGIPATTIVRVSKHNPKDVAVVFLGEHLAAGKKMANLSFEKIALNGEKTGIANANSKDELNVSGSTSSWGFAFGRNSGYYGRGWGGGGYYHGSGYGYGYGRGYGAYGYSSGYAYGGIGYGYGYGYLAPAYIPSYNYLGYGYPQQQYWGYEDDNYTYGYCDPGYAYGYGY